MLVGILFAAKYKNYESEVAVTYLKGCGCKSPFKILVSLREEFVFIAKRSKAVHKLTDGCFEAGPEASHSGPWRWFTGNVTRRLVVLN